MKSSAADHQQGRGGGDHRSDQFASKRRTA
jgi:hypothetical protein